MTVDFHTHTFPDKIAAATVEKLGAAAHLRPNTDGTKAALLASMRRAGIARAVVLPVVTNPLKTAHINDYSARVNGEDGIFFLGGMHPQCPEMKAEMRRIRALGMRGIKLHPVYQGADINSRPFLEILYAAAENGLFVVTHAGDDIGFPGVRHCTPAMVADAMRQVGDVRLILAHCGGWKNWEDVPALAAFPSLMLDTSFSLGGFPDADGHYTEEERRLLSPEAFTELVRAFGADRVLFGSDSPWTDQKQSLDAFRALPLTDAEQAAVLGGNAADLLGI